MSRFDTDGDGYIDGEEFLRFIRKDSVPEGPGVSDCTADPTPRLASGTRQQQKRPWGYYRTSAL